MITYEQAVLFQLFGALDMLSDEASRDETLRPANGILGIERLGKFAPMRLWESSMQRRLLML